MLSPVEFERQQFLEAEGVHHRLCLWRLLSDFGRAHLGRLLATRPEL